MTCYEVGKITIFPDAFVSPLLAYALKPPRESYKMLDALVNRPNTILEQQKRFQVNLPFLLLTPSHQSTTQTDNDSFVRLGGSASCVPEDA